MGNGQWARGNGPSAISLGALGAIKFPTGESRQHAAPTKEFQGSKFKIWSVSLVLLVELVSLVLLFHLVLWPCSLFLVTRYSSLVTCLFFLLLTALCLLLTAYFPCLQPLVSMLIDISHWRWYRGDMKDFISTPAPDGLLSPKGLEPLHHIGRRNHEAGLP